MPSSRLPECGCVRCRWCRKGCRSRKSRGKETTTTARMHHGSPTARDSFRQRGGRRNALVCVMYARAGNAASQSSANKEVSLMSFLRSVTVFGFFLITFCCQQVLVEQSHAKAPLRPVEAQDTASDAKPLPEGA